MSYIMGSLLLVNIYQPVRDGDDIMLLSPHTAYGARKFSGICRNGGDEIPCNAARIPIMLVVILILV